MWYYHKKTHTEKFCWQAERSRSRCGPVPSLPPSCLTFCPFNDQQSVSVCDIKRLGLGLHESDKNPCHSPCLPGQELKSSPKTNMMTTVSMSIHDGEQTSTRWTLRAPSGLAQVSVFQAVWANEAKFLVMFKKNCIRYWFSMLKSYWVIQLNPSIIRLGPLTIWTVCLVESCYSSWVINFKSCNDDTDVWFLGGLKSFFYV